ncbi:MAG TPA: gas vesicle protein GvpJ [Jatrophihabitans sp.]|nr:gas vesicle protein GvpJ [Jatrophihabitans sp.]
MTSALQQRGGGSGYVGRPAPSGLADVVEMILDKGLVIDAYVRVSLVGIELLTIDARIVIASVDTYLRFAEATNRLDLYEKGGKDLPELMEGLAEGGARGKTKGALGGAKEKVSELIGGSDDDEQPRRRPRERSRQGSSSGSTRRRSRRSEEEDE